MLVFGKQNDRIIRNHHAHAWLNSRLCSVAPSNLIWHCKKTHEHGYSNIYLEFSKLDVWFCPNDPKGMLLNGLLPQGVAEFAGATIRSIPGRMLVASRVPVSEAENLVASMRDRFEQARRRGYLCTNHGYVRGAPRMPYYETDRAMGSLSQKPHMTTSLTLDIEMLISCGYILYTTTSYLPTTRTRT